MSDTQNQWIPVSERLPDGIRYRVVRFEDGTFEIAIFNGVAWRNCDLDPLVGVTHWMDLPAPPAPPKPADPFEAWWPQSPDLDDDYEIARAAWHAARVHYAKALPVFEAFARKHRHANTEWLQFDGDGSVSRECALSIWNSAQGKPEA